MRMYTKEDWENDKVDYAPLNDLPKETSQLIEGWMLRMAELLIDEFCLQSDAHLSPSDMEDWDICDVWERLKSELEL